MLGRFGKFPPAMVKAMDYTFVLTSGAWLAFATWELWTTLQNYEFLRASYWALLVFWFSRTLRRWHHNFLNRRRRPSERR